MGKWTIELPRNNWKWVEEEVDSCYAGKDRYSIEELHIWSGTTTKKRKVLKNKWIFRLKT